METTNMPRKMIKALIFNGTPLKISQKRIMFCLKEGEKSFWYGVTTNSLPNEIYGFLPYKQELLLLSDKGILVNNGEITAWENRFVSDAIGKIKSIEITNDDLLMAKTDKGNYVSSDAGKTWEETKTRKKSVKK